MSDINITPLTDPVAIVHIPIFLIHIYTTKIYWTLDRASEESPEFFNITSNRIEMAIFGSIEMILHEWSNFADEEVLINSSWRVFEISSGDDGDVGNYDSPHLRQVSAPLARAGISILYQSSYFTDFLLVKADDFDKAEGIFAEQGWHVDAEPLPTTPRRQSQLLSPLSPTMRTPTRTTPAPATPQPEITVISSPLAFVGFCRNAEQQAEEKIRKFLVWPERVYETLSIRPTEDGAADTSPSNGVAVEEGDRRPFISYTRNEDGASLVTEIRILRAIFPEGGRHEVDLQSGGELGEGWDDHLSDKGTYDVQRTGTRTWSSSDDGAVVLNTPPCETSGGLEQEGMQSLSPPCPDESQDVEPGFNEEERQRGSKMCLQLDLRGVSDREHDEVEGDRGAYHLDNPGLLTRFSDLLTSTGSSPIRMLYSSTFHTANILVEARDVKRAKGLLEKRRKSGEWPTSI
ncbi:hypothetical protein CI109_103214 [Kwoniella shandongensis]|uniref:Uncharacterized protein n=1 Tax=Kwoniella shandongensis TaxID=1734106 RepID=A0A5M6C9E5_9TREE|nr:uncharacterized protein CI109_000404 [Kwoniella shandongensis]KAA5531561.1 hypothetical protein CI109_000404 [Kwoniella shandongensis]